MSSSNGKQSLPQGEPLSVDVYRDDSALERTVSMPLQLPDGRKGIKWNGLAFPLLDGQRIQTAGQSYLPAECRPWAEPTSWWRVELGEGGVDSYVFLDGGAAERDLAVQKMREFGLNVLRSGPNMSGDAGDWFIRVAAAGEDIRDVLTLVLGATEQTAPNSDTGSLRERLLIEALETARTVRDTLRDELAEARLLLEEATERAAVNASLQEGLQAVMNQLAKAEVLAAPKEHKVSQPHTKSRNYRLERELAVVAKALLTRLELLGDSLSFMAVELPERSGIWRALAQLDREERGRPDGWKSVGGAEGWIERHFSTGQDDQGRVYARMSPATRRWGVLVSHKQDQPGDMRNLRSWTDH